MESYLISVFYFKKAELELKEVEYVSRAMAQDSLR